METVITTLYIAAQEKTLVMKLEILQLTIFCLFVCLFLLAGLGPQGNFKPNSPYVTS